ncbi:pyridoxal phosphate homeostasis protein [Haloferula helveola]
MDEACTTASRSPDEVRLLAVSKTFPADAVLEAWQAGQVDFGESRQQEGSAKVAELPEGIRWHFIGGLQRNKVRKVLQDFDVLHSVDSLKLASHIDRIAGELQLKPEVYLEVNLAGEASKGGFGPEELSGVLQQLVEMENLSVNGLMAIPPAVGQAEDARPWFRLARELRDRLEDGQGVSLPGLSMGMSGDFEVAIEEGATIVRVGSSIFGDREVSA